MWLWGDISPWHLKIRLEAKDLTDNGMPAAEEVAKEKNRYCCRAILLAAFALVGCGSGGEPSITAKAQSDRVALADAEDPAMLRAFAKARGSLDVFLGRVAANDPQVQEALVKIRVQEGDAVEYFWIGSLNQTPGGFSGIVKNDPEVVHNIKDGQTISFPRTQIFDWTYTDAKSGKMIGNYTACALLTHEKPSDAAEFRRTYNLDCDP